MKIKNVDSQIKDVFIVTFAPSFVEKLFGKKETVEEFRGSSNYYLSGGGGVYIKKDGTQLEPFSDIGKAIDAFRRKW